MVQSLPPLKDSASSPLGQSVRARSTTSTACTTYSGASAGHEAHVAIWTGAPDNDAASRVDPVAQKELSSGNSADPHGGCADDSVSPDSSCKESGSCLAKMARADEKEATAAKAVIAAHSEPSGRGVQRSPRQQDVDDVYALIGVHARMSIDA
jgi:hypothetical protein